MDSPNTVTLLPLAEIDAPEYELRVDHDPDALHELAQDIATRGLLQPIGVVAAQTPGRWRRVWGGRRCAAFQLLGRDLIPALILDPGQDELGNAVAENLFRRDLSPIEEALAIQAATAQGLTVDQLRIRLHRSERWISARLDLLSWPADVQHHVHRRDLALSVAEALAHIDNTEYRAYLIESAIQSGASALMARAWLADYQANRPRIIANQATVEELKAKHTTYRVMLDCDGCGDPTEVSVTRTLRICRTCADRLDAETRQAPNGR